MFLIVLFNTLLTVSRYPTAQPLDPALPSNRSDSVVLDIWEAEISLRDRFNRQNRPSSTTAMTSYNYVYAFNSGVLSNAQGVARSSAPSGSSGGYYASTGRFVTSSMPHVNLPATENYPADGLRRFFSGNSIPNLNGRSKNLLKRSYLTRKNFQLLGLNNLNAHEDWKVRKNAKKLMYYLVEANVGRSFIKEPCFSADGRVMCSPYKEGVRLLAFGQMCSEYPNSATAVRAQKRNPRQLTIIKHINNNDDTYILSTKFSPREPLLVTGSQKGKITWHYPLS